jgi:hypothetical protein
MDPAEDKSAAHRLRHLGEQDAANDIARAAAGERDNRGDRPCRIILGLRHVGKTHRSQRKRHAKHKQPTQTFHS